MKEKSYGTSEMIIRNEKNIFLEKEIYIGTRMWE